MKESRFAFTRVFQQPVNKLTTGSSYKIAPATKACIETSKQAAD